MTYIDLLRTYIYRHLYGHTFVRRSMGVTWYMIYQFKCIIIAVYSSCQNSWCPFTGAENQSAKQKLISASTDNAGGVFWVFNNTQLAAKMQNNGMKNQLPFIFSFCFIYFITFIEFLCIAFCCVSIFFLRISYFYFVCTSFDNISWMVKAMTN